MKTKKSKIRKESTTMGNAKAQVNDFLEKIGDYLMTDYGVDDVEKYNFGSRIIVNHDGATYYVEVGLTDNQPVNESEDIERKFTYKGITITRYDYESLPDPMAASKLSDQEMEEIAKDIYFELLDRGWSEEEIQKYTSDVDDYDLPAKEMRIADKIRSDWWEAMENVAREHNMEYYEDMEPVDESNESDETEWFDAHGDMVKHIPMDCILDCSSGGQKDNDVAFWVDELNFHAPTEKGLDYIKEYGLDDVEPKDVDKYVLWIMCGNIKDEAYEFCRGGSEYDYVDKDAYPEELDDWSEENWDKFQDEVAVCHLGM